MNKFEHILDWAIAVVVGLAIVAVVFMIGYTVTYNVMSVAPQENAKRVEATVKAVCDYSRDRVSGELEEVCGIAQDTSGTTYLCNKDMITAHCFVKEDK